MVRGWWVGGGDGGGSGDVSCERSWLAVWSGGSVCEWVFAEWTVAGLLVRFVGYLGE